MNSARIFISCFTIISFLISCVPKKNTAKEYRELAEEYSERVRPRRSAKALMRAIQLDSNDIETYVFLAEMIMLGWDSDSYIPNILDAYSKALRLDSSSSKVLLSRARFYEFNAQYKLAEDDLNTILSKDPTNTDAHLLKARLHFGGRDTSGFNILRSSYYQVAMENRRFILNFQADKEYRLGLYHRSIETYKRILALTPDSINKSSIFCTLSGAYFNTGHNDSACFYYKKCEYEWFYPDIDKKGLDNLCGKK